jgi:hypothetical protein
VKSPFRPWVPTAVHPISVTNNVDAVVRLRVLALCSNVAVAAKGSPCVDRLQNWLRIAIAGRLVMLIQHTSVGSGVSAV